MRILLLVEEPRSAAKAVLRRKLGPQEGPAPMQRKASAPCLRKMRRFTFMGVGVGIFDGINGILWNGGGRPNYEITRLPNWEEDGADRADGGFLSEGFAFYARPGRSRALQGMSFCESLFVGGTVARRATATGGILFSLEFGGADDQGDELGGID